MNREWGKGLLARLFCLAGLSLALFVAAGSSEAYAAKGKGRTDPRELQAREAFAAGRYQDALDIYAKLYAEKLHPTYLRNIGRCHQNMGSADEAITTFRDYLRKAPNLSASEKNEVEGFIAEMEALKEKQKQAQTPPPPEKPALAGPPPGQSVVGQSAASNPGAQGGTPAGLNLQTNAKPQPEASPPVYKRAWFWVAVGAGVTAAVVGALWAGGAFSSSRCRGGYTCQEL